MQSPRVPVQPEGEQLELVWSGNYAAVVGVAICVLLLLWWLSNVPDPEDLER